MTKNKQRNGLHQDSASVGFPALCCRARCHELTLWLPLFPAPFLLLPHTGLSVMIGTLGRKRALQRLRNEAAFTPSV